MVLFLRVGARCFIVYTRKKQRTRQENLLSRADIVLIMKSGDTTSPAMFVFEQDANEVCEVRGAETCQTSKEACV